ncbi:UNVERIFIED_CONTAM: hypothetical protein PYX00_007235 [Menopon gallinae]|uniref:Uncharacterized protein n=1 Tax=Menopon gallinae TaxID=328185 RepID=A0AAW2HHZ3_9NEOP
MKARKKYLKNGDLSIEFHTRTDIAIRKNLVAVLSIASCTNTWNIFRNAEDESILHLAITEADCPRLPFSEAVTVPVVKGGGEFSQIILDLKTVHGINWKSVVLFYESTAIDRDEVQKIIASLSLAAPVHNVDPASVSIYRLDGYATEWARRKQIYNTLHHFPVKQLGTNFLVIVSRDLVGVIMEVAKSVGLVHPLSQWLYMIPDTERDRDNITGLTALLNEGDNVSFIYNATSYDAGCSIGMVCHIEELLKSFTIALDRLIREEIDLSKQVSDEEWETIRPSRLDRRTSLLSTIKTDLSENGRCDQCIAWEMKAGETWGKEYQGRSKRDNALDDFLDVGVWHPREGPIMRDILFPHVVHGFRGRTLPLVSFNFPPWQIIKYNESGHVTAFKGLVFEIIDELANSLNFSYSVIYPTSERSRYGLDEREREGGNQSSTVLSVNWEKMIAVVREKQVFMGAGAFIVTEDRKRLINFTVPIGIEPYTFMVARPQELSRALLFLSPFTGDTWLCIATSIALMGPILNWFHRMTPYYDYFNTRTKGGLQTVSNCIWYMYGALLQQGGTYLPMADSGRLIVGTWWLYVLVVVTTYSGNLVAFLTFPRIDDPINTIAELVSRKGSVTWGMIAGSPVDIRLKAATDPKYRELYDNAEIHSKQDALVIDRVRKGEHVYIDWKTNLLFLMKREFIETGRCDFSLGTEEFLEEQVAMIVAQGNPYLARIDEEIKRIHRVGLIYKWLEDYLPKKDKCWSTNRMSEVTSHTVNMSDMQGSFFVLFLGKFSLISLQKPKNEIFIL